LKEKIEVNNLGYIKYYPEISKSKSILKMRPNWHPMGTLRIGNASNGVVNENLLVHGTKHVYVLSPAVFPTGSNQNPVFTTLALAMKLADHFV
jgi:choline dehydrogenase-like flavoprotein